MRRGILRVTTVNFLCLLMLFYSGFKIFREEEKIPVKKENTISQSTDKTTPQNPSFKTQSETEKTENTSSPQNNTQENESSSVQVSAKAIKGNIISQYNSPYTASLSYDKVYVKNNSGEKLSIKSLLEGKISFKIKKNSEPQVLIYHTHATESFKTDNQPYFTEDFSSRSRDNSKNMVSVGKIVAEKLNSAGIKTLHSDTLHDYPGYSQSYSRSAQTINYYLKKYPTIKVIIDFHRDAVSASGGNKVKLVTQINGKAAAQVMIVQGCQSGSVTNFPNWKENLKLATKFQQTIEKNYPTLARPMLVVSKNYNQSLSKGAMLVEIGTDVNTLEEVHYSAELVGDSLVKTLNNLQ